MLGVQGQSHDKARSRYPICSWCAILRRVKRLNSLNEVPLDGTQSVLFYDRSVPVGDFPKRFAKAFALEGGETLKSWDSAGELLRKLSLECSFLSRNSGTLFALGGGTVGDVVGFVASVFERGVRLELIPSTWLAAIDSSHGGKTGLNGFGFKNKIGTFYPANEEWLVRELLENQPERLQKSARAELTKMAWIDGGAWTGQLSQAMWDLLPEAVAAKLRIVDRDPFERSGERAILNLGHTVGHVFESALGLDHGSAVGAGLGFAVEWSRYRRFLSEERALTLQTSVEAWRLPDSTRFPFGEFKKAVLQDKKRRDLGPTSELREAFLFDDPSRPLGVRVGLEWVSVGSLIEEAERQGVVHV